VGRITEGFWKSTRTGTAGLAWFLSYLAVRMAVESAERFSRAALIAIVILPVIPAGLFLYFFITDMRLKDELQRRIQLEALAIAYPLILLLILTLGLLQLAVNLNPADWSYRHLGPFVILFYVLGLWVSTRRYR
jgi:heme/copper-type cytochrome/quinol oxidase subunit 4